MHSFHGFSQSLWEGRIQSEHYYKSYTQLTSNYLELGKNCNSMLMTGSMGLQSIFWVCLFEDIIYMYAAIGKTKTELIVQTS